MSEYEVNYQVKVTKVARRQGEKIGLPEREKLDIIQELKLLKYWPDIHDSFEFEKTHGAIEFKFNNITNKWIRVFVFKDDDRKIMWIIKVLEKKTNAITTADQKSIQTAVSRMKQDLNNFKKIEAQKQEAERLKLIKGGKSE